MIELERTFTVDRPVEMVVGYLVDFSNTEQWDPGTTTCRRLDDGPVRVGSRWHNVSEFRGRETELEYSLVRLEPSRLTFTGKNKTVTATDDIGFRAVSAGTEVRYSASFDFHGFASLAQPFLKGALNDLADQTVEQMSETLARL